MIYILQVASNATIQYVPGTAECAEVYCKLDAAVKEVNREYVVFDENEHTDAGFQTPSQRYKFIKSLRLTVDVDMLK